MTPEERDRLTNHPDPKADHEEALARLQAAKAAAGERLAAAICRALQGDDYPLPPIHRALTAYNLTVGPAADAEAAAAKRLKDAQR